MYRIDKKPSSFFRPLATACLVGGIVVVGASAPPEANAARTKSASQTVTIVDFEEKNLLSLTLRLRWMGSPVTIGAAPAAPPSPSATTLSRPNAPFYLDVDGYQGVPVVNFPIEMAPGTNGMQPNLNILVKGIDRSGTSVSGMTLTGMEALSICGTDKGLCLGDEKLVPIQGAAKGTLFTMRNDPRTVIRSLAGGEAYRLEDGNGLRRYYTPKNEETAETGPWALTASADWFENFVRYHYAPNSDRLELIEYGQDKTAVQNIRSIQFSYRSDEEDVPVQITSKVGDRIVRRYSLQRNETGRISEITECAADDAGKLACYAPYEFNWALEEGENSTVLQSVGNGKGGRTQIRYQKSGGVTTVAGFTLLDKENKMQEKRFHFVGVQKVKDLVVGFDKFRVQDMAARAGKFVHFGSGDQAGVTLNEGEMTLEKDSDFTARNLKKTADVTNVFAGLTSAAAIPFVLTESTARTYNDAGKEETVIRSVQDYDARGRIKLGKNGDRQEATTYLDEIDKDFVGEDYANLVVERSITDTASGANVTKKWAYQFEGGLLAVTKVSGTQNGQPVDKASSIRTLDIHGNVIQIQAQGQETTIRYDEEHASFPISMEMKDEKTTSTVEMKFDPETGQVLSDSLPDGSETITTLDAMGRVIDDQTVIKNPDIAAQKEKPQTLQVRKSTTFSKDSDGNTVEIRTATVNDGISGEKYTHIVRNHTDSLGRQIKIENEKQDADGTVLLASSMETRYTDQGLEIIITDDTGSRQLTAFNTLGQLIREESDRYGMTEFAYNEKGQVSQVTKGGQAMTFVYDSLNRLVAKKLPGDNNTYYEYDENFPQKVSKAILPAGREVRYSYTKRGQVDQKTIKVPDYKMKFYEFVTDFDYEQSKLKSVVYPDGSAIEYQYDGERLASINWVKEPPKDWPVDTPIVSYHPQIEENGMSILNKKLGNGLLEQYRWLKSGKLSGISLARKSKDDSPYAPFSDLLYEFNADTNLLANEQRTETLREDKKLLLNNDYKYDKQQQLETFVTSLNGETTDRASFSRFNDRKQIVTKDPANVNVIGKSFDLSHDVFGNISRKRSGSSDQTEYLFDIENRLTKSSVSDGRETLITEYYYDHLGERIEKVTNGVSRTLYISPFYEFTEFYGEDNLGEMQETRYVWDHMGRIAAFTNDVTEEELAGIIPAVQSASSGSGGSGFLSSIWDEISYQTSALISEIEVSTPAELKNISPLIMVLILAIASLIAFEKLTEGSKIIITRRTGFIQNRVFSLVSMVVMVSFVASMSAPSVQAALESGDGTPKSGHVTYFH
ncbi:MAG: RHS repeat protein, partial [Sneathiella sp.]|nr:RHS repeat protein [Sneathiella sp.]